MKLSHTRPLHPNVYLAVICCHHRRGMTNLQYVKCTFVHLRIFCKNTLHNPYIIIQIIFNNFIEGLTIIFTVSSFFSPTDKYSELNDDYDYHHIIVILSKERKHTPIPTIPIHKRFNKHLPRYMFPAQFAHMPSQI